MLTDADVARNISLLLDRNLEAGRGEQEVIRHAAGAVTYQELLEMACAAGQALADLGVRREERVLLVLDDTPGFPAVFLGAIRIGAVPIPVNPLYKASDYAFFLEDSYARVVVADEAFTEKVTQSVAEAGGTADLLAPADLTAGASAKSVFDPVPTHPDDMGFWLYSSGSTGRPKGVVHRQADMAAVGVNFGVGVLDLQAGEVTYSSSKLFHAYGLGNSLAFPYWVGATTVLTSGRPNPDSVFAAIEEHRPSVFYCVPTLYNALLASPGAAERDLSSVRMCVSAAEPLPPEVFHRWEAAYGVPILDGIGSTELLHIYCSNVPGAIKAGSSGRPVPGYELQIRDLEGRAAAPGETGELFVKGGSALAGYWHHRERTERTLQGEWFATGDRYHCDEDGFFWYEGRSDDMIKVGGLWVSPIEVENTLMEHAAVLEAAVVGVEVDGFTRIHAHVIRRDLTVPVPDGLGAELQEWCKSRLQRYQYPHQVHFPEELPKTVTGKIQRFALRQPPSGPA